MRLRTTSRRNGTSWNLGNSAFNNNVRAGDRLRQGQGVRRRQLQRCRRKSNGRLSGRMERLCVVSVLRPLNAAVFALQIIGNKLYVDGSFANGAGIESTDFLVACNPT